MLLLGVLDGVKPAACLWECLLGIEHSEADDIHVFQLTGISGSILFQSCVLVLLLDVGDRMKPSAHLWERSFETEHREDDEKLRTDLTRISGIVSSEAFLLMPLFRTKSGIRTWTRMRTAGAPVGEAIVF